MDQIPKRSRREPRRPFSTSSSPGQPKASRKAKIARGGELLALALLASVVVVGYLALLRAQNSPPVEQPSVPVGEPVIMGSVEWTVTGVDRGTKTSRSSDGEGPEKVRQQYLVTVDLSLTNNSGQAIELEPQSTSLLYGDGIKIGPDTDSMRILVENADNMTYGRVDPGSTRQGQVIFNVPLGVSDFVLEVEDFRMFNSKTGRVDLGLRDQLTTAGSGK